MVLAGVNEQQTYVAKLQIWGLGQFQRGTCKAPLSEEGPRVAIGAETCHEIFDRLGRRSRMRVDTFLNYAGPPCPYL